MRIVRLAVSGLLILAAACGEGLPGEDGGVGGGGAGGSGGGSSSGTSCSQTCTAKAQQCSAPTGSFEAGCSSLCAKSPTEAQMSCFQSQSCNDLGATFQTGKAICGIGSTAGGSCTTGSAASCDGDAVVTCPGGITVREVCTYGCKSGQCVDGWQVCQPYTISSTGTCSKPCPDRVTLAGKTFCTVPCGQSGMCPTGTTCGSGMFPMCNK